MGGFKGQRKGFAGLIVTTIDNTTWGEEEDKLGYGMEGMDPVCGCK